MWRYLFAFSLLFTVAFSQDTTCPINDIIAIQTCANVTVEEALVGRLLQVESILDAKAEVCATLDRDEFERLAACAHADEDCEPIVLGDGDSNPYILVNKAEFQALLESEYDDESERIKLTYDMLCDDTCSELVASLDDGLDTTPPEVISGTSIPVLCQEAYDEVTDEADDLVEAYNELSAADNTTYPPLGEDEVPDITDDAEKEAYCGLEVALYTCRVRASLLPCATYVEAVDTTKLAASLSDTNGFTAQCENLVVTAKAAVIELIETGDDGDDTGSADTLRISTTLIVMVITYFLLQ